MMGQYPIMWPTEWKASFREADLPGLGYENLNKVEL
jgi:hypothetical protein